MSAAPHGRSSKTAPRKEFAVRADLIRSVLRDRRAPDPARVRDILAKAGELHGLGWDDVAALSAVTDPALLQSLFDAARRVKETIYGRRLVLFAPLYISNLCHNECLYCAFRSRNRSLRRRSLTLDEVERETRVLIDQGHKRLLVVAGETASDAYLDGVLAAIERIYSVRHGQGEIRRVNVNIAPLTVDQFRRLLAAHIGTYQLFQETYDREVYERVHLRGQKADYEGRLGAMDRAMEAGFGDVGIGVLFGLADWRFELLAVLEHIAHLEKKFGVGPHTISVPRLEPAVGSAMSANPPTPVSDADFLKIVAILRLAVPYTGLIMSTRESPEVRRQTFALGVSQISAGSRTNPGGYAENADGADAEQFSLGDHRPLDEVIRDIAGLGYVPSFCTACYRLGRTGRDFMDLAKPGDIKRHCDPNALSTFLEYLLDYASPDTLARGEDAIRRQLDDMDPAARRRAETMISKVRSGRRDVFC
ncbi:MAG TPA: [FeFe] hydrogenase H-cluster radical SAM maturase HydG [Elusimicrobiota bacterium]|nr:[FeFe] hydrogenase H-cluster radical SAM maturase HydG [Elusimicrobiota bacterium]